MTENESIPMTKDPICGMTVDEATALHADRDGEAFSFCSEHCRKKFLSTPVPVKHEKKPNEKAIYTCPMHPEVQQEHPGDCPKCGMALELKTVTAGTDDEENAELRDMTRRMWLGAALALPVLAMAMGAMLPGAPAWLAGRGQSLQAGRLRWTPKRWSGCASWPIPLVVLAFRRKSGTGGGPRKCGRLPACLDSQLSPGPVQSRLEPVLPPAPQGLADHRKIVGLAPRHRGETGLDGDKSIGGRHKLGNQPFNWLCVCFHRYLDRALIYHHSIDIAK
jgi:YHS domain-containing protein